MRKLDVCDMEEFGRLESSEEQSLSYEIDGGRRRRNRTGIGYANRIYEVYGRSAMSAQMLEVSLLGVGTVLRLEGDAWSMVKGLRHKQQMNTLPPSPPRPLSPCKPTTGTPVAAGGHSTNAKGNAG